MQDWQEEIEPLKEGMIGFIQDWCETPENQDYSFEQAQELFNKHLKEFGSLEQKKIAHALLKTGIFKKILLENFLEDTFFIMTLEGEDLQETKVSQEGASENFSNKEAIKGLKASECSHFTREVRGGAYDKILRIS